MEDAAVRQNVSCLWNWQQNCGAPSCYRFESCPPVGGEGARNHVCDSCSNYNPFGMATVRIRPSLLFLLYSRAVRFSFLPVAWRPITRHVTGRNWKILVLVSIIPGEAVWHHSLFHAYKVTDPSSKSHVNVSQMSRKCKFEGLLYEYKKAGLPEMEFKG